MQVSRVSYLHAIIWQTGFWGNSFKKKTSKLSNSLFPQKKRSQKFLLNCCSFLFCFFFAPLFLSGNLLPSFSTSLSLKRLFFCLFSFLLFPSLWQSKLNSIVSFLIFLGREGGRVFGNVPFPLFFPSSSFLGKKVFPSSLSHAGKVRAFVFQSRRGGKSLFCFFFSVSSFGKRQIKRNSRIPLQL